MSAPTALGSSSAVAIRLVEIDRLDIERLAHMGAAVAQYLHHLVPILRRVEMRLHRLRLGHHLAQRQRSRENLDENHVHGLRVNAAFDWWLVKPHAKGIADQIRSFDNLILLDVFHSLNPTQIGRRVPRVCMASFILNQARVPSFATDPDLATDEVPAEKAAH